MKQVLCSETLFWHWCVKAQCLNAEFQAKIQSIGSSGETTGVAGQRYLCISVKPKSKHQQVTAFRDLHASLTCSVVNVTTSPAVVQVFPWLRAGTVTGEETAEQTSTSFQPERLFTSLRRSWFCLTTRSGLRDITSDTASASNGEKEFRSTCCSPIGCLRRQISELLFLFLSAWPSIPIKSGLPRDSSQESTKMDGWEHIPRF